MKNLYAKIFAMLAMVLAIATGATAQDVTVKGKITDSKDGSGLPGVNILLTGTVKGVISDIEGNYSIDAQVGSKLEFRFLGYTTEFRVVGNSDVINVSMTEEVKNLKEAVVIGYGQVRKKDLTGSLANVTSKDFQTGTNVSPEALIAGKVAGVQITNNGGAPGSGSTIRIRGASSLSASNDPLIIIDGIPVDGGGINGSANALSMINPNDIESFTVLKDASATAIYGSRASNGVILITTKRGNVNQKPNITFSTNHAISQPTRYVDVLSGDEFRAMVKQYGTPAQRALIDTTSTTNTDWQREIFRVAYTQDHNLSGSGNIRFGEGYNLPYRISGGYLRQEGILKRDRLDRGTIGLNLNPVLLDGDLKVNISSKYSKSISRFANQGAIGSAVVFDPTKPVNSSDSSFGGFYEWTGPDGSPLLLAPKNPVGLINALNARGDVDRFIGNVQLDYAIPFLKDLRATLNLGTDIMSGNSTTEIDSIYASNFLTKGFYGKGGQKRENQVLELFFNYNKELPSIKSRFDVMGGHAYQFFRNTNYNFPQYRFDRSEVPNTQPQFDTTISENALISYFGRLNYVYNEKYLLTASIRTDGSSRFAKDNRWGVFPSVAAAWTISEEGFLKNVKVINQLKLRASYGMTGQQDIGGNYPYLAIYRYTNDAAQYQFGNQFYPGFRPNAFDSRIRWESTTTTNLALDYGILDNRISGTLDFYLKKTNDLLNTIPLSAGTNTSDQVTTNVGNMENRGFEFQLNTIPVKTKDLIWNLGFNVTYNQNKITKLTAVPDSAYQGVPTGGISGGVGSTVQIHSVGYPLNSFFVYRQVYKDGKPVEGQFEDLNGDGIINESDRYRYKQSAPLVLFGLSSSVSYGKFTAGIVLRGTTGNYVYNNIDSDKGNRNNAFVQPNYLSNVSANYNETGWTGRPTGGASADQTRLSDYFVHNASFLRIDNISLGYNFGDIVKDQLWLSGAINIQNAFVFTKYKGIDPEIAWGIDNNFYPRPRVFTLGLTASFNP